MANSQTRHEIPIPPRIPRLRVRRNSYRKISTPDIDQMIPNRCFFPGNLVGPYLDYAEYTDLVNETVFKDEAVKSKHNSGRMLPPGRKRAAYTRMIRGLAFLGVFVFFGSSYSYASTLTPGFAKLPYWRRWVSFLPSIKTYWLKHFLLSFLLFQAFGPFERAKYYAIWTLTEGASILTGLGFTGFSPSGSPTWNGAANVQLMQIEFAPNFKVLLDSWNMKTNVWLRECIYKRVAPKGRKPGNRVTMITFLTSALWVSCFVNRIRKTQFLF